VEEEDNREEEGDNLKRKGSLRHLRRSLAPSFWPILRKEFAWAVKPSPGPHPSYRCIPLGVILRDVLKYARTMREARRILGEGKVKVDGRVVRDYKFPVGLMDVIELASGEVFRMVPHPQKFMVLHPISEDEASFKLLRVEGKNIVKGGHIELHFHDGRNHLIRITDPRNPVEDVYKTYDVIKMAIPKQEILDHIKFEKGVIAIVVDGRNVGKVGSIVEINQIFKKAKAIVTLRSPEGRDFRTILSYVFPLGREKPLISLPEECFKYE